MEGNAGIEKEGSGNGMKALDYLTYAEYLQTDHWREIRAAAKEHKDMKHGMWLNWLAENCREISQQTASRYMQLYEKIKPNYALMSNLTCRNPRRREERRPTLARPCKGWTSHLTRARERRANTRVPYIALLKSHLTRAQARGKASRRLEG